MAPASGNARTSRGGEETVGGLAMALAAALREYSGVWFGWSGKTTEGQPGPPEIREVEGVTVATVDLDAIAKARATGGTFDIWRLIGGRVPVTVTGLVNAHDGRVRFDLESAEVSGVPVPTRVVQELVDYYSRSPERPNGLRLDDEFALPAGIRDIELSPGTAVVVQ